MSKTIDYPDLDAAIDAESWQWLQDAAPGYADAATAALSALMGEVERLRALADSGALGDGALAVVGYKLRDWRRQVEALGVGL